MEIKIDKKIPYAFNYVIWNWLYDKNTMANDDAILELATVLYTNFSIAQKLPPEDYHAFIGERRNYMAKSFTDTLNDYLELALKDGRLVISGEDSSEGVSKLAKSLLVYTKV